MESWTLTWTKLLPLKSMTIREMPDNTPGVYRFSYKEGVNYYVFYAGQARNLKERILDHFNRAGGNICVDFYLNIKECFFRYTVITRDYVRDATERQVYDKFAPICNEMRPKGSDYIKVNLN